MIQTKKWVVQDLDMAEHYHPEVDLDPNGMPCVTAAVLNLEGDVTLCLQLVLGPSSPRIHLTDSRAEGIAFEQAAQWYVDSLCAPLQCVIESINKKSKMKEDYQTSLQQSLLGLSGRGDGNGDGDGERKVEAIKNDSFCSFSAPELSNLSQQRDHVVPSGMLDSAARAIPSPADWAASILQKADKSYLPSVPRSGSATPGSVSSRRSSG